MLNNTLFLLIFSYLEGDQLLGKSSVQAYINALRKGCKCVECKLLAFLKH